MVDRRPPGGSDSPDALVRLARTGDEAAFARIVRLHRTEMVRVCFVVTGDLDLSYEAVASAWPVAWSRVGRLRDPSRLGQWLCGIAASEACRIVRPRSRMADPGRRQGAVASAPSTGSGEPAADPELARGLAGLRVEARSLLALRHVARLTPAELGRAIGADPAAALAESRLLAGRLEGIPTGDAGERVDLDDRLGERLRAYADVPVSHVNIDVVARAAKVTRHDARNRIVSLVIAIIVAALVISVPYLGDWGTPQPFLPGVPTASPASPASPTSPAQGD